MGLHLSWLPELPNTHTNTTTNNEVSSFLYFVGSLPVEQDLLTDFLAPCLQMLHFNPASRWGNSSQAQVKTTHFFKERECETKFREMTVAPMYLIMLTILSKQRNMSHSDFHLVASQGQFLIISLLIINVPIFYLCIGQILAR